MFSLYYLPQVITKKIPSEAKPARHSFVAQWISSLPEGASLLDAGAGTMRYKRLCEKQKYISHDFGSFEGEESNTSQPEYTWDSKKCDLISDITTISLDTSSIDFIMCTEVIEHLPRPREAIRELARILKPGGQLLITAPFSSAYHQEPFMFYSGFSKYFYKSISEELNLSIKEIFEVGSASNTLIADIEKVIFNLTKQSVSAINRNNHESYMQLISNLRSNSLAINKILHSQPEAYFVIFGK